MNYYCDHCGKSTDESSLEAWPCKLGTCMHYNWPDGSTGRHRPAPACCPKAPDWPYPEDRGGESAQTKSDAERIAAEYRLASR